MMIQYAKFVQIAEETTWRPPLPAFTYIETSTLWRQEHNGKEWSSWELVNLSPNTLPLLTIC
jgi:phosphoketolase